MRLTLQSPERKLPILFYLLISALIIEVSLSNISDIISSELASVFGVVLFVMIYCVVGVTQYFILNIVNKKNKELRRGVSRIHILDKAITIVQYVLMAVILFSILQIIFSSVYYTPLLIISTTISYGSAAIVMGMLSFKLLSWFRSNRSIIVLFYGLGSIFITINAVDTTIFFDAVLLGKQLITSPQSEVVFASGFPLDTPMGVVTNIQTYSVISYFVLLWISTAIVLRYNIQRIGKIKFYVLVSLPLIYFLSYYFTLYSTLNPATPEPAAPSLLVLILIFGSAVIAGGVLIALAFRSIAKAVHGSDIVRYYMMLTAYGFVLFFISASATLLQAAYPPYGLVSVSLVGLSSFLIFSGLYYSAISMSQDVKLRRSIKKSTTKELKVLDSIGTAQVDQEIEKKVLTATKNESEMLARNSGIESSLSDNEIKEYMEEVWKEIKKRSEKI
jgi:hypothetical protein